MQNNDIQDLITQFHSPAFPGSYLLSFEGIEGAGKSTQIKQVAEYLESLNFNVLILREPGGTSFGEKLRHAILESNTELNPISEMHLFASSRAQLLQEVTLKELNNPGTIIIYDRYLDSSIAYQGVARKVGVETILKAHTDFPLTIMPHMTFYLEIDLQTSHDRQKIRNAPKDYFESRGDEFYKNLIEGYEICSKLFPNRIKKINALGDNESIFAQIKKHLEDLIRS